MQYKDNFIAIWLSFLAWATSCHCSRDVDIRRTFRAAVVEYISLPHVTNETAIQYIGKTLESYEALIRQAANEESDIVIFPEYGLTSTRILSLSMEEAQDWMQEITSNESLTSDRTLVVRQIRKFAVQYDIYVVVNLATQEICDLLEDPECPSIGYRFYNTQIAVDRNGLLVGKYRKFNRYGEEHLFSQTPGGYDVAYFDADFGVRIGLFICFDIHFNQPWDDLLQSGVEVIAYSTSWVDELPFLTALQYHPGWSLGHGIVLLASARHSPPSGAIGSGVYDGNLGILNYTLDTDLDRPVVLVQTVTLDKKNPLLDHSSCKGATKKSSLSRFFLEQDLTDNMWLPLLPEAQNKTLTLELDSKSSCILRYGYVGGTTSEISFAFVGYRGVRTFGGGTYFNGVDNCGVVACTETNITNLHSCGKMIEPGLGISGHFMHLELVHTHPTAVVSMPVTLQMQMLPLEFTDLRYRKINPEKTMLALKAPANNLYSLGLFARAFELDL